jgi:plasmid stability protein
MAQVLVRDVDPEVVERLKARAKSRNRSLEAEIRSILNRAAGLDRQDALDRLHAIQGDLGDRSFSDSVELLREDRER